MLGIGRDIIDLLKADRPHLKATKPAPLLLDRITLGAERILVSKAQLFQLPVEILGHITRHFDKRDLSNLALVNSDCWQLARSRQFVSWTLDYGPKSSELLLKLRQERQKGCVHHDDISIGACIRQLRVWTDATKLASSHGLLYDPLVDEEALLKRCEQASIAYHQYVVALGSLLEQDMLPNLDSFSWHDQAALPPHLLNQLAGSSIRKISLLNFVVREEYDVQIPKHVLRSDWPLKVLELDGHWDHNQPENERRSLSSLHQSILGLCAASLQVLVLGHTYRSQPKPCSLRNPLTGFVPQLNHLRTFVMSKSFSFADSSYFEAILGPDSRLVEAEIDLEQPSTRRFFETPRIIPSLKNLSIISSFDDSVMSSTLAFLQANPQITSVQCKAPLPLKVIDYILQALCDSCQALRTLSLHFLEDDIPLSTLSQLSQLPKLEQLSLTVSPSGPGSSRSWMPSHYHRLRYLSGLHSLRQLIFNNDAYSSGFTFHNDPTEYYTNSRVHPQTDEEWDIRERVQHAQLYDLFDIRDIDEDEDLDLHAARQNMLFEIVHEKRIREIVAMYATALPKLEYMWVGRIRWSIDAVGTVSRMSSGHDEVVDLDSVGEFGLRRQSLV